MADGGRGARKSSTARAVRRRRLLLLLSHVQLTSARCQLWNKAIGERLVITEAAVRKHVGAIFARLAVRRGRPPPDPRVLVYLSRQRQGESIGV